MNEKLIGRHLVIEGKVQGVFFRKNTKQQAKDLKLSGWVKNTADDKVEILLQGKEENINKFIDWCKQGPPKAEVEKVHIEEKALDSSLNEFLIVYED